MTAAPAHAKFSPSAASRWVNCPGSIVLEGEQPRTTSTYADQGTAAHHLASQILERNLTSDEALKLWNTLWWRVDGDGKTFIHTVNPKSLGEGNTGQIDEDFINHVMTYVHYVRDLSVGHDVFIEVRVGISDTLGVPGQFGTSDFIAVHEEERHMHVADLKFGTGEQVYAENNYQGMLYALGALSEMEVLYGKNFCDHVTIHICQPRLDHLDPWMVRVEDLRKFGEMARAAVIQVTACQSGQVKVESLLSPSDKACRWCKVQATCPALGAKVSELFSNDPTAIDAGRAPAMTLAGQGLADNELLSRRYAAVDLVDSWIKAVRAETERRVFEGQTIEGSDGMPLKVVDGRAGNRAWKDDEARKMAEALLLGQLPPDKVYEPAKLVSVAVAEKALGIKKKKNTQDPKWLPFVDLIHQAPGSPAVALGSDPRPPRSSTAPQASAEDFAPVSDPLCD